MRLARAVTLAVVTFSAAAVARADDFDTGDIFGFTQGSSVGDKGDRQFSTETDFAFGRRDGRYRASETNFQVEYTPSQKVQLGFAALAGWHDIKSVTGLADRDQVAFSGLSGELKYLLLERGPSSPLSITLSANPTWRWSDQTGGGRVTSYDLPLYAYADLALIKDSLFLGSNLLYEPATTHDPSNGPDWMSESTGGISVSLSYRVAPSVTFGGEAWYLRHYDSIALNGFTGDAVFLGPTLFVKLTPKTFISAAWNVQVAGHERGVPGSLDLADFSRQRAKFKLGIQF